MKVKLLLLVFAAWAVSQSVAQDANTLVSEGRVFLTARNLTNANARFAAAVASSPNHETANALYAVTRLLRLPNQPPIDNFLNRLGVSQTNRNVYHWATSAPTDTNGVPLAPAGVSAGETLALLRTNILPQITAAAANLARITNPNFLLALSADETTLAEVTVDYGDVLMLRALLHTAECLAYTISAQNLDVQLAAIRALYESEELSIERVLSEHPQLLTFATTNDLEAASLAFQNGVDRYQEASAFIRNRPEGLRRLFNWDVEEAESESKFRQTLVDLKNSIQGPVVLTADTNYTVWAGNLFNGRHSWRELLPAFRGNQLVLGSLPDATFGSVISGLSDEQINDQLAEMFETVPGLKINPGLLGQPWQILFYLARNRGYVVQASVNLIDWQPVAAFFAETGLMIVHDPDAASFSRRFYRIVDLTDDMPPPANDNFANRMPVSGLGVAVPGYNTSANRELGEPIWSTSQAGRTVWFEWTATATEEVVVSVKGLEDSGFYPEVGIFTGSTLASLTQVINGWEQTFLNAQAGTTYFIAVDGYRYSDPTGGFKLVIGRRPTLRLDSPAQGAVFPAPGNVLISGGASLDSTVHIYGEGYAAELELSLPGGDFSYSWTNLPPGRYWVDVVVIDHVGISAEDWTSFRVAPANDLFANRIPLPAGLPQEVSGSTRGASLEPSEPWHAEYVDSGGSVWWSWTAPASGYVTIECWGNQTNGGWNWPFSTALAVYTGNNLDDLEEVASRQSDYWGGPSLVYFSVTAGTTYQIAVDGGYEGCDVRLLISPNPAPAVGFLSPTDGAQFVWPTTITLEVEAEAYIDGILTVEFFADDELIGAVTNSPYRLDWNPDFADYDRRIRAQATDADGLMRSVSIEVNIAPPPPVNDNFADRLVLSGSQVTASGSNQGATREPNEPWYWFIPIEKTVWWTWTAPANGTVTISIADSSFYAGLIVYTGSSFDNLEMVANNDGPVAFNVNTGVAYQIAVGGYDDRNGDVGLSLDFQPD